MILNAQMRLDTDKGQMPLWRTMLVNVVLMIVPYIILSLYEYLPLSAGKALPNDPLTTIVRYQFIPILGISGAISTCFFRKTGHVWVGASRHFLAAPFFFWSVDWPLVGVVSEV